MSSAILSADDLNDFINPGIACIKPIETLPKQQPIDENGDPYQVTTEDKVDAAKAPPAQISLTDCLACSGCVTSAEAVLVSLQSHNEVLDTLDKHADATLPWIDGTGAALSQVSSDAKIFVASVSPQSRASIAATYNVTERQAGNMISQLLSGPLGLRGGGAKGSGFTWIIDTSAMRDACLVAAAEEVRTVSANDRKLPLLTSACPGWICYAEKTHPHILPHLSRLKSPQALTGTLVKSVLARKFGVHPANVWHMAVMPCFDKKLEASRSELTSHIWNGEDGEAIRDVDCVITARELLMLAESRDISFPCLPKTPVSDSFLPPFPDPEINKFLFQQRLKSRSSPSQNSMTGTSGGYLNHILRTQQSLHPGSTIEMQKGRNADVADFVVIGADGNHIFKAARYYGFRNIQNLVRRLKPPKPSRVPGAIRRPGTSRKPAGSTTDHEPTFVEVMACPGGCTNGGGQIKVGDVATLRQTNATGIVNGSIDQEILPAQKEWLAKVDEAYWSADSDDDDDMIDTIENENTCGQDKGTNLIDGIDHDIVWKVMWHWGSITGVELDKLIYTTYRIVESDVGKSKNEGSEMERVSALAVAAGGGW